jgi:uncharacterized protein (UPF0305 family)
MFNFNFNAMGDYFDNELNEYLERDDETFYCPVCDKELKESGYCSYKCYETDMR